LTKSRQFGGDPRARLLAAAVDYAERHGVSDLSLRELAAAIGSSHRMLIYHFGSKEGLLVAVIQAVEEAQRRLISGLSTADPTVSPADAIRMAWQRFADPKLWPQERLFFEIYGQALQGRPGTVGLLDSIVETWVDLIASSAIHRGTPPATARAEARLAVAVVRGLLLDLLATGDRPGVDDALERYIASVAPADVAR
jgi:AcrR family transcriptional regulator